MSQRWSCRNLSTGCALGSAPQTVGAAGVEVGDTNLGEVGSRNPERNIRVPHLIASLVGWATPPFFRSVFAYLKRKDH